MTPLLSSMLHHGCRNQSALFVGRQAPTPSLLKLSWLHASRRERLLDLANLQCFARICLLHFDLNAFIMRKGADLHFAIREDDDATAGNQHVDEMQIGRPAHAFDRPLLQVLVVRGTAPGGRIEGIDAGCEVFAAFRLDEHELGPLRLPFEPEPLFEHPLTIEAAAARVARLIDCTPLAPDAVRTPDTGRLFDLEYANHLAAQRTRATCPTRHYSFIGA